MNVREFSRTSLFKRTKSETRVLELLCGVKLRQVIESFILNCQVEQRSPRTIRGYRDALTLFADWLDINNISDEIAAITPDHMRHFLVYVMERPSTKKNEKVSNYTVHKYYQTLKTFFTWAKREGLIVNNPLENINPPKLPQVVIPIYKPDDIKKMLATCDNASPYLSVRNKALIIMALDTGLRLHELLGLTLDNVSIQGGIAKVKGKGNKERIVHFGKLTQQALLRYQIFRHKSDNPRLWLTEEGRPLTPNGWASTWKRLTKEAGIEGRATIHMLRHTFATTFLDSGDPLSLQYLLGHSSLSMVKRYTESKRAEQAIEQHRKNSPVEKLLD